MGFVSAMRERERECDTDTVILMSPEKTPIIEDSLYRTEAHAVIPLNGKSLFVLACYAISLFFLQSIMLQRPVASSPFCSVKM